MKWSNLDKYNDVNSTQTVKSPLYSILCVHFTLYKINYYYYDYDDDDDDDYYITVDLYITIYLHFY